MKKRVILLIAPAALQMVVLCWGVIDYGVNWSRGLRHFIYTAWLAPFTLYVAAAVLLIIGLSVCCYWWKKRPILRGIVWLSILVAAVNGLYLLVTIGGLGYGFCNWALIALAVAEIFLAVGEKPG